MPVITLPPGNRQFAPPVPPNTLVGREHDIDALTALLTAQGTRLLTLSGPGGVGKTHLALELAALVAPRFQDGVVFVPLSSTRDPSLVVPTIAQSLGLHEAPGQTVIEILGAALANLDVLVILDNMEQVMDAAPDIGVLVAATSRPLFLVTSRSPLRLRAEREYPILPLALPPEDVSPSVETCKENAAVRLFVERSQAVRPSFTLTDRNAPVIAGICRKLDGLPLAIELAAALTPVLSPQSLLSRMDQPLPLLVQGAADLPDRQRTLRNTIAWSYDLLDSREQVLFRRLSVFAGGASLDAIQDVMDGQDILGTIGSLVTKSLLMRLDASEEPRFLMLSTIREFAGELMIEHGEDMAARGSHLDWLMSMAQAAEQGMTGPQQVEWLDRLDLESQNIRAGLTWALDHAPQRGMEVASMLWRFWATRGLLTEGYTWLCRFLQLPVEIDDPVRAKAHSSLGNLCIDLGTFDDAAAAYSDALRLWERLGDTRGIASTLNGLGLVDWYRGDHASARERHQRSLDLRRQVGDRFGQANSLTNLGNAIKDAGDPMAARVYHEQALAIRRELGDRAGVGYSYLNLGDISRRLGDIDGAREMFRKSLAAFRDVGDRLGLGYALHGLGMADQLGGRQAPALALFEEALGIRMSLGDRRGIVECIEGIAASLAAIDRHLEAVTIFAAAHELRRLIGAPLPKPDRAVFDPLIASIRRALSQAEFASRWSEGEAMSLTDAASFAKAAAGNAATPTRPTLEGLSDREVEVVLLVAAGLTNAQVAERLYLSRRTVDAHLRRIYDKLDFGSRAELIRYAMEHNLA
jgi:predicted ATPase/DNA-binding CsgD family transcriptional regulator